MSVDEGKRRKDEGMQRALDNASQEWKEAFYDVVESLPDGREFTSEDIIAVVGLPNGEPGLHKNNGVGGVMGGVAKRGLAVKAGRHISSRTSTSHAAELTVWVRTR